MKKASDCDTFEVRVALKSSFLLHWHGWDCVLTSGNLRYFDYMNMYGSWRTLSIHGVCFIIIW